MKTIISEQATIPEWVHDLASFRRWANSEEFPEQGRFAYLDGHLWVDLTMERLIHNQIKKEINRVLANLERVDDTGSFVIDRMLFINLDANLSVEPDGMFVSARSLGEGRVTMSDDSIEVVGSPDMALEIISPTSVNKDTGRLRLLYWEAGVQEYWLVDSRDESFSFDILRRSPAKYLATRKNQGWIKSQVFEREFKLSREMTKHGVSKFTLEVR